ncbi:probable chitinase 10 [Cloeon dipterum]|uniref:probable chitinase 10 n=1 Tax=Cloeon dipterum TaxID=197152 RepID=UPI00321FD577
MMLLAISMHTATTLSLVFMWLPVCIGQCQGNKSAAEVKRNLEDSMKYCIAECLNLRNKITDKTCLFKTTTGKLKGCDVGVPDRKIKFKVICKFDDDYDISVLVREKGQPLCDILILPVAMFNKETNLMEMQPDRWDKWIPTFEIAKGLGIKLTVRIGAWNEWIMHPRDFTKVAKNEQVKTKFAQGVVNLVKIYDLDGITISWMWPRCPQGNCIEDVDRKTVASFVRALAVPLKEMGKVVIYHMTGVYIDTIMAAGDYFSDIVDIIDYFYFETNYQSGDWSAKTDFNFNLKQTKDVMKELTFKIKRSQEFKRKVLITVEPLAFNYELSDPNVTKLGAFFVKNTQMKKTLHMPEWCMRTKDPVYQLVKNAEKQNYAFKPHNLFIFDDQDSLTAKINFVMEFGAGVGMHSLVPDDMNGVCGCGRMPYLRHVVNILKMNCEPIPCF